MNRGIISRVIEQYPTDDSIESVPDKYRSESDVLFHKREFLNQLGKGSSAHINAQVELVKEYKNGKLHNVHSSNTLKIADCNSAVDLSISTSPDYYENSLFKLDLLIKILTEMKDAVKTVSKTVQKLKPTLNKPS